MITTNDLNQRIIKFEHLVISSFSFLENAHKMRRGPVRISNRNDPRDVTAKIRFESESHRFDVTWAIGQNGLGIMIWNKSCLEKFTVLKSDCSIYFESFIEYLTNGGEKPIVPQVYPKMSTKKLIQIMDERKQLLALFFDDTISKLANKLELNLNLIVSKDMVTFTEYHKWLSDHQ